MCVVVAYSHLTKATITKIMGLVKTSDLKYHYSWTAIPGDNPRVSGLPDSTFFSRTEGYEVVYLINKYAEMHNLTQLAEGLKVERMIKTALPGEVRSQANVRQWIFDNWSRY